ncbi:MAG: S-layer homology domain-containing protein, partial [Acidimicrobiia bacterium]|nr:S-layer homology domain-containing protein [Acidimicrobiia bacterium]
VFEADIEKLAAKGITRGCNPPTNDRFCPNDPVTRGQMAAFLVRALGLSDRGDRTFVDDDDSVFEADIERLAAAGITAGCNPPVNDRFCPEAPVTRGAMAAFLRRALEGALPAGAPLEFVDDDASVFEDDIEWLSSTGVTKGCSVVGPRFCPDDPVTRGQMAAFIIRALGDDPPVAAAAPVAPRLASTPIPPSDETQDGAGLAFFCSIGS